MPGEREEGAAVRALIDTHGPLTIPEIARELGRSNKRVWDTVNRMRKPSATLPQRLYVSAWRSEVEGEKPYLRPVFALGAQPDEPKPKLRAKKLFYADYYKRIKMSSVFNLGLGRETAKQANRLSAANQEGPNAA